uniref:Retrotransposon gag domain-containing protein n=1 Tax=Ananas comosus var. bracteatus TaxID=296719 RepID=A0A6V7QMH1_ANACO|nr:unnamed protein product [Ananas comosus var. bracteatus]
MARRKKRRRCKGKAVAGRTALRTQLPLQKIGQGEEENPYPSQPSGKNYEALSEDPSRLQPLTQRARAGANTRLKLAAMSRVATNESGREQNLMLHSPLDLEDDEEEDAGDKDLVTIEKLIRRIEERDNRIDQMANQMNTMMDAMNTLLKQQQQQQQQPQAHHQSARQSQLTEQAPDANPWSMERQGPPYQHNPTANEPTTSHETHFISVKRDVSLGKLAELKQGRDEKVEDYVARNMITLYPDELKPTQAIELCTKGMQSWYSMEVSRYKPTNITELMIVVRNVELEYRRSPEILALYKNAKAVDDTRKVLPHYDTYGVEVEDAIREANPELCEHTNLGPRLHID